MRVVARAGDDDIATVYVARTAAGKMIEFVESVQPPLPRQKKWVLIISTLYGCPVGCRFCDAGGNYQGRLSYTEIMSQIDYMVTRRFPDRHVPVDKFKVQFARVGEPAFNENVLGILKQMPRAYDAPGLLPAVSTVAPKGTDRFFQGLLDVKRANYGRNFQLQFSVHTTDDGRRKWLIPAQTWDLGQIARYGERFHETGDRKIALNFALAAEMPVEADTLTRHFDPRVFLIKITPVNPTYRAVANRIRSHIVPGRKEYAVLDSLRRAGYEVILSIGEVEENKIGSNCGQYITHYLGQDDRVDGGYTYALETVSAEVLSSASSAQEGILSRRSRLTGAVPRRGAVRIPGRVRLRT